MDNVKDFKIIAVDTSLGTNFILSAHSDATISELRGMIQKEHLSCFTEHQAINVGPLLVVFRGKQYRVTDHLLVGQVFSKCWNKIHAVVSLGTSRPALCSNSSKPIEGETSAGGWIPGASLDVRQLVKSPKAFENANSKVFSGRQSVSNEAPTHAAAVCHTKALDDCIGKAPAVTDDQDCSTDCGKLRCPVFSSEAPYTQPCSELDIITKAPPRQPPFELDIITRAAARQGEPEAKRKRKRKRPVKDMTPVKKVKEGEVDGDIICGLDRHREASPKAKISSNIEGLQTKIHEGLLESVQPGTDCKDGFNGEGASEKGDFLANHPEDISNNNHLQDLGGPDSHVANGREQSRAFHSTYTQTIVSHPKGVIEETESCRVQKETSEPFSGEKEVSNAQQKTHKHIRQLLDETGTKGFTDMSIGDLKDASLNDGAQVDGMDLSRGYPIQLNDHTILLVASVSADVVPETQESQMDSQDDINRGGEAPVGQDDVELCEDRLKYELHPVVASVEPEEMEAPGLPIFEDARHVNTRELDRQVVDENPQPKSAGAADQPSENFMERVTKAVLKASESSDWQHGLEKQQVDASCSGNSSAHGENKIHISLVTAVETSAVTKPRDSSDGKQGQETQLVDVSCSDDSCNISVRVQKKERRRSLSAVEAHAVTEARESSDAKHGKLADASCSGDSHNLYVHRQNKTYRRRKVSEKDPSLMQGGGGIADLNDEERVFQGNVGDGEVEAGNETNTGELLFKLDIINVRGSDDMLVRSGDPVPSRIEMKDGKRNHRKRHKQKETDGNESSLIPGEHITESQKILSEPSVRTEDGGEHVEGHPKGGQDTTTLEILSEKERAGKASDTIHRKKKKRRKERSKRIWNNDAGMNTNISGDGVHMYEHVNENIENGLVNNDGENGGGLVSAAKENKELLNVPDLSVIGEDESKPSDIYLNSNVGGGRVVKKKSKRKKRRITGLDVEIPLMQEMHLAQEPDQTMAHANVNGAQALSEDVNATVPSPASPFKEPLQEDDMSMTTKQHVDVFEFESSETANRQKEDTTEVHATSDLDADNLDKLCSVAVNIVEDEMLNPLSKTARRTPRKIVHPKRWVTVLSERLAWNQASNSSAKKQRANRKSRQKPQGSDDDFGGNDQDEAREGSSSQIIVDDGRIECPYGCGRSYSKKTSAYYRHCRMCIGSNF